MLTPFVERLLTRYCPPSLPPSLPPFYHLFFSAASLRLIWEPMRFRCSSRSRSF
jgi:hypothetical protein